MEILVNKVIVDESLVPQTNLDSKLMEDMLRAARFIVEMREAKMNTITDDAIVGELQKMIENQTIDCMFATVTMVMNLIEMGKLKKPKVNFAARFMAKPH